MIASVLLIAAGFSAPAAAEPPALPSADLRILRLIPVQYEGRCAPLDTLARDMVERITGSARRQGRDPVLAFLDWTFRPMIYAEEPLIPVGGSEVRRLIGLPAERSTFSLSFLRTHPGLGRHLDDVMTKRRQRERLDPLDEKVEQIGNRMSALMEVFEDEIIRPVPDPHDGAGRWLTINEAVRQDVEKAKPVKESWDRLRSAFVGGNAVAVREAALELSDSLTGLSGAFRPDRVKLDLELRYHLLDPFSRAWKVAVASAALAVVAMLVRRRLLDVLVGGVSAGAFALVTYGIGMRWQIADRIPAANMYESMIFMGWGLCLATMICLLVVRNRLVTMVASVLTWISLMLADVLPLDSFIRPVAPVLLDTAWMAIHVPVIMVSYSVLAIAMAFALAILGISAVSPGSLDVIRAADRLHARFIQVGSVLLTAGIITGSMWGSASWGRYWGWDPKEVWSLVALLGYLAILHARLAGWLRAFGTALCSTLAFWLILMTYVGVNFVLGTGLHSYAFGKGAVARWLMIFACAQWVLTGSAVLVYLLRRRKVAPTPSA